MMREIPYLHRRGELPPTLQRIPLLARLNEPGRDEILRHATLLECDAGDVILRENDPSDAFYILLKGKLRVCTQRRDIASIAKAGETFGEIGLLRNEPRSATVMTLGPAHVLRIDAGIRETFDTLAGARASVQVFRFLAESLAERLVMTSKRLATLEEGVARGRVYRI